MEHGQNSRQPLGDVAHIANRVPIPPEVQALRDPRTRNQYIHPDLKTKYVPGPHSKFIRKNKKGKVIEYIEAEIRGQGTDDAAKRLSHLSAASSSTANRQKNFIGPWELGKRLGAGSTAVVRVCRHRVTHEMGAVKIVPRALATLQQAGSLGNFEKLDEQEETDGSPGRMPVALEREVTILKLIVHPNIMKLLDIWENRSEIYLVTEYVEQGDLFGVINDRGALPEEEAIHYFRQMMRALEYCHSFNICHRDLKPENILLKKDGTVKIADFRMAALHQNPSAPLLTACGSPHYAAPELLHHHYYRGSAADIWSMGVILYAMLSATLPFDDSDMSKMLARAKRAEYTIPACIGKDAKDLIRRMLVMKPSHRITMEQMWIHVLITRYDYLDDMLTEVAPRALARDVTVAPIKGSEVDSRVLRQLKSMWHSVSEKHLLEKLASDQPNDHKLFYKLMADYRHKQLENYNPAGIPISSTDHHLSGGWEHHISTCKFTEPARNGHARAVSKFSVISTVPQRRGTTETVRSYDPYNASRKMRTSDSQVTHARITVHRSLDDANKASGTSAKDIVSHTYRSFKKSRMNSQRTTASGATVRTRASQSDRGSVVSLPISSRPNTGRAVHASSRHKRGVDFSNVRKASSVAARSRRGSVSSSQPANGNGDVKTTIKERDPPIFHEELRKFSSGIAKDCDEAFGSSLLLPESDTDVDMDDTTLREGSPFSLSLGPSPAQRRVASMQVTPNFWDSRPLPPPPAEDICTPPRELTTAERRTVSTPVYNQFGKSKQLPSIWETHTPARRHASDTPVTTAAGPTPRNDAKNLDFLSRADRTIWMVNSAADANSVQSDLSSVKAPAPLKVTKSKRTAKVDANQLQTQAGPQSPEWRTVSQSPDGSGQKQSKRKTSSWFRRLSKEDVVDVATSAQTSTAPPGDPHRSSSQSTSGVTPIPPVTKKKPFGFSFWKNTKPEFRLSLAGPDHQEAMGLESDMHLHPDLLLQHRLSPSPDPMAPQAWDEGPTTAGGRRISVHQNWLARLLRIKPATRHLCFAISKRRARQEVAILLREWRRYGIRDVQVDKERNVVFARVSARNHVQMKAVEFAIEIMTVIEHGKRNHLAIARFTQERGAASSFHRVVDTISDVFLSRGLLVAEKKKAKMMVKTLTAA